MRHRERVDRTRRRSGSAPLDGERGDGKGPKFRDVPMARPGASRAWSLFQTRYSGVEPVRTDTVVVRYDGGDRARSSGESSTGIGRFDGFKCSIGHYPDETGVGLFH